MIRSIFRQFYLCVKIVIFFLIPLELAAGDAFRCGDWECTSFGYAKTLNSIDNIDNNEMHRYHIWLLKNENNTLLKYHYLSPGVVNLKKGDDVIFKFDNSTEIRVPVIDTNQNRVVFSPLDFLPLLEMHLKKEIHFSIHIERQKLAGPFSLIGSKQAIDTVSTPFHGSFQGNSFEVLGL